MPDSVPHVTPLVAHLENDKDVHRDLVKRIEDSTQRNLVCYFANFRHGGGSMMPDDDKHIEMCLNSDNFKKFDRKMDLILSSPGGYPEAAEKLCHTLRSYASHIRVIVPKYAWSAATVLSFGADELLLGETSELGPIDPQMVVGKGGEYSFYPARTIIDAYQRLIAELGGLDQNSPQIHGPINHLGQLDPMLVQSSLQSRKHAELMSTRLLKHGLMKGHNDEEIAAMTARFIERGEEETHSTGIRFQQLEEWHFPNVSLLKRDEEVWKNIWELFTRAEAHISSTGCAKYILNWHHPLSIRA